MDLIQFLEAESEQIVTEATESLTRSNLARYNEAGPRVSRERLAELFRMTVSGIRDRNLSLIIAYMGQVAHDRYHAGYAIREVQIAINVLEESIWTHIVRAAPPEQLAEALGLVSTTLGAAKDALARGYVSLACEGKAPSLDLSALFEGKTSG